MDLQPNKRTAHPLCRRWGAAIRERRDLMKIRQDVLASVTGIPQQTISKIEHGKFNPSVDTLLKLAQGLGLNPAELYHWPVLDELPPLEAVAS